MSQLKLWLAAEIGRGVALARHLKRSPSFVNRMGSGDRPIPVELAAPIEAFTDGEVTRQAMFPATWRQIWPELAREIDAASPPQTELFSNGDGQGAAGHDATLTAAAPAVHYHAGVGR